MDADATLAGEDRTVRPASPAEIRELSRGDLVGRFVVLERKGGGSMGVVYAAYDPELDRKVALKLLRPWHSLGRNPTDERRRLLREAQAIARVSHPNVIAIHDVGEHQGGVFLAMEYVDGPTLAQWSAERPRGIDEILAVFVAAGRGLAAAHAKDLVHRDFKPDNVMLDHEVAGGRVRVLDFGLVRSGGDDATSTGGRDASVQPTTDALASELSQEGAIVGTPAYMAPEQLAGKGVEARSDQFSFCIALHEAVYGQRPFLGGDLAALTTAIAQGTIAPPPAGITVPAWLRRVIVRGLAVAKDERWPDMNALVAALSMDRPRRRSLVVAATGVVVAVVAALGVWLVRESPGDRCARETTALGPWDGPRRGELEQAVIGDGSDFRRGTWTRIAALIDARAASLAAASMSACVAAPTDPLAAARHLCVLRHRRELDATIAALLDADLDAMVAAIPAVTAVPDAVACDDDATLGEELMPPSPVIAAQVQLARDAIARIYAETRLGHYASGMALAEATLATARTLAYRPLVADATQALGSVYTMTFRNAEAEASLREAFAIHVEVGDVRGALRCARGLTRVVGNRSARPGEGLVWGEVGRALLLRGDWVEEEVLLGGAIAAVYDRRGDPRRAIEELEQALAIGAAAGIDEDRTLVRELAEHHRTEGNTDAAQRLIERVLATDIERFGADHPWIASDMTLLASVLTERGEHARAVEQFRRGLVILEQAFGPDDERIAILVNNMAAGLARLGEYDESLQHYERALAITHKNLGVDHPDALATEGDIATLLTLRGEAAVARARLLVLLPRVEQRLGPEHVSVSRVLGSLAFAEASLGLNAEAVEHLRRASTIAETSLGVDHIDVASLLQQLGEVELVLGHVEQALPLFERVLAIYAATRGRDHVDSTWPLVGIGRAAAAMGDRARAITALEQAVAGRDAAQVPAADRAHARFALARVLWVEPKQRARARALAATARDEARDAPALQTDIDAWLRQPR